MNLVGKPIRLLDRIVAIMIGVTYRDIFGFGMMLIGIVAIWKPAGSIALADVQFGLSPVFHGIWYIVSGWLLSRHRASNAVARFIYTVPLLFYIFLTLVWIQLNWERANLVILVQYIMLYASILKLIAVKDD